MSSADETQLTQHLSTNANQIVASKAGRVALAEGLEIHVDEPLAHLSRPGTSAFVATDAAHGGAQFALVCDPETIPRIYSISSYQSLKSANIMHLLHASVIDWPQDGQQRFAMIFDNPPQKKLMTSLKEPAYQFSEQRLITSFIAPILTTLAELRNIDLVHGAVNAKNLFIVGAEGAETTMLGECLSAAPSSRQPVLFESIERSMTQPCGRGAGTFKDDLYAFGVCIVLALRGDVPLAKKAPDEVINTKISEGTYGAIIGRERVTSGIAELLRGVLSDDVAMRWDIDEAMQWLEGRRLSPKQPRHNMRAARPFHFKDEKHRLLKSLAYAFSKHPVEAVHAVEDSQFDLWIKRNFEDVALEKRLEDLRAREANATYERYATHLCMAIDPRAPVYYKDVSVLPLGIGNALAVAYAQDKDIQVYAEILAQQFFSAWVNYSFDEIPDATGVLSLMDRCRNFLQQKILGYGLERALYTLSPECICMSPILKGFFVLGLSSLLTALETIAHRPNRPENIFDRHIVAFLSVRESKVIDPFLGYITSVDPAMRVVGYLRCLVQIQRRSSRPMPVPGLTAWMAEVARPGLERFKNKDLRDTLLKKLDAVKGKGRLEDILKLIDDVKIIKEDAYQFTLAQQEYRLLQRERKYLSRRLRYKNAYGRATGRQAAMLVSSLFAMICMLTYIVAYFAQVLL